MSAPGLLESVLKREPIIVLVGLAVLSILSWGYLGFLATSTANMNMAETLTPLIRPWGIVDFTLMFVMWAVMMTAMMVPSAAPMILLFSTVSRRRHEDHGTILSTGKFLFGYLTVWGGFALLATTAQWALQANALLSPMMVSKSPILGGLLLSSAGIFQWTRMKYNCLTKCRNPLDFLMSDWREGSLGAFFMGLRHGTYCLGCCWLLMTLLFVLGVMNLLWIAALALLVLVEKVIPRGRFVSRLTGVMLAGWGIAMVYTSLRMT